MTVQMWKTLRAAQAGRVKIQACFLGYAQTHPDATQPKGEIYTFSKMAVTFKPIWCNFNIL